jgi:hypothetical protein
MAIAQSMQQRKEIDKDRGDNLWFVSLTDNKII